jgi:hypothetical protein
MVPPLGLAAQLLRIWTTLSAHIQGPLRDDPGHICEGPVVVSFPRTPPATRPTRHGALPRR